MMNTLVLHLFVRRLESRPCSMMQARTRDNIKQATITGNELTIAALVNGAELYFSLRRAYSIDIE